MTKQEIVLRNLAILAADAEDAKWHELAGVLDCAYMSIREGRLSDVQTALRSLHQKLESRNSAIFGDGRVISK